jgi:hypothetical protein
VSTTIWSAYRTKYVGGLWPLVADLRRRVERRIRGVLKEEFSKFNGTTFEAYNHVNKMFKEQHPKQTRDYYGMDVSISFRDHLAHTYLIPYANGMMSGVWDFLRRHPLLEDFHYQNQTDKSAKCSDREWEIRRHTWDLIGLKDMHSDTGRWHDSLVLDVLSPPTFFRLAYPLIYKKGIQSGKKSKS